MSPPRCHWRGGRERGARADPVSASLAEFAGREVAAVDGLLQELRFAELPELVGVRIGLDHRVPELLLVVAEYLLLSAPLDVDVLHGVAHIVEAYRTTDGIHLDGRDQLHERLRAWPLTARLLHDRVHHLACRVGRLGEVGGYLAVFFPVFLDEGRVLGSV